MPQQESRADPEGRGSRRAYAHWRRAQGAFLARFGHGTWTTLAVQFGEIVAVARTIPEDA